MVNEFTQVTPVKWPTALSAAAAALGILMLPTAWALRGYRPTAADKIKTLDDDAAACQRSGLSGWELVTFAQRLVYRKFACYSCHTRHGMGYCTQYNLALKQLVDRLGFATQAVFSFKVRVADNPEWTMGPTWLRVRVGNQVRDICAGHASNLPGQVSFTPLAPVWPGYAPVLLLSHLGMILFCGFLEWRALLMG